MSFGGAIGLLPKLVVSRWLMAPWLSIRTMETVPTATMLIARIGVNLWLPAAAFVLLFLLMGLHRRTDARGSRWSAPCLTLAWVLNIALTFVPLMTRSADVVGASAVGFLAGMILAPVYLGAVVAGAAAAINELSVMRRRSGVLPEVAPWTLLAWALVPPVLSVLQLLAAPSNPLAQAAKERSQFEALCKGVGVRFMARPAGPVRSIAYDWDPQLPESPHWGNRIATDGEGRMVDYQRPGPIERQKSLVFDFTESRRDGHSGPALIHPEAAYYHFPDRAEKKPYFGVDALTADVLAFAQTSANANRGGASAAADPIRYTFTLTDRRSGEVLGVQTFVVDQSSKRACGANVETVISEDAFIYDAIHR